MHSLAFALVLILRTYDLVGVPPSEIAGAERTAAALLHRAQIEVSWVACQSAHAAARHPLCDETQRPGELFIRIVALPGDSTNAALADAYIDKEAGFGWFATIYFERVRSLAAASDVDAGTLMGRAIAHEVGHLILGTSGHSPNGLMRAMWSASMLRHERAWAWTFSKDEAAHLRTKLSERLAPSAAPVANLIEPFPPGKPCGKTPKLVCAEQRAEFRP